MKKRGIFSEAFGEQASEVIDEWCRLAYLRICHEIS